MALPDAVGICFSEALCTVIQEIYILPWPTSFSDPNPLFPAQSTWGRGDKAIKPTDQLWLGQPGPKRTLEGRMHNWDHWSS